MFSAVLLNSKQKLVVPSIWCKRIDGNNKAIIFNSKNKNALPVFIPVWRNYHAGRERSYNGIILRDNFSKSFFFSIVFVSKIRIQFNSKVLYTMLKNISPEKEP